MFRIASKRVARFLENSSFIRHYLWKYRRWVGVGLLALVIVDFLEVVPPLLLKRSIDCVVDRSPLRYLIWTALTYLLIAGIQGVCRYVWRMYLIRTSVLAGRDLRKKYAYHIFGLPLSFFDRSRMGNLLALATTDVEAVRYAIGTGLLVFADALFYLVTIPVAMLWLSPHLTVLVCLPLPLIPFLMIRNEKKVHARLKQAQECQGRISALIQESIQGAMVVKSYAREDVQLRRVQEIGEEYFNLMRSLARVQSTTGPSLDLCTSLGTVLLIFVGGGTLIAEGISPISLGTFVAFQRYLQKLVWPMAASGMAFNYYQKSVSSTDRLKAVFARSAQLPQTPIPLAPRAMSGRVEFRGLTFCFPESTTPILQKIDLTIEPGERVAFMGPVGSGKSVLLSLLPRLYPVAAGMLWVDGVDANEWGLEELRHQVGYVSQEVFLFSETVTENISLGLLDGIRKGERGISIEEASQIAAMDEEIEGLSEAYQTQLGERGGNLSGGQRQRLTLARALVKQPAILVLDNALSSIDAGTEEKILQRLRNRKGRNTELIAAHRASTIQAADRIVVLHQGRVLQVGTHQELARQSDGLYYKYFKNQKFKEDLESYPCEISSG